MLSNLVLSGFKSISQSDPIELSALTMFCGSNSSGKSSFIQSILLLGQTFGSRFEQDSMVLNGHLVRLGSFSDIKTHMEKGGPISIGFTIGGPFNYYSLPDLISISFEVNFGNPDGVRKNIYSESNFHPPINSISVILNREVDGEIRTDMFKANSVGERGDGQLPFSPLRDLFDVESCNLPEMAEIGKEFPGYKILGCDKSSIVPNTIYIEYDFTRKISSSIIDLICGDTRPIRSSVGIKKSSRETIIPNSFFEALKRCILEEFDKFQRTTVHDFFSTLPDNLLEVIKKNFSSDSDFKANLAKTYLNVRPESIDKFIFRNEPISLREWQVFLQSHSEKERKSLTELINKHRATLQEAWYLGMKREIRHTQVPLRTMHYLSSYLSSYFSRSVKYLGPLRNEPQAVYSALGHSEPKQVGLKGEFTAAALHVNRLKVVSYPSPISRDGEKFAYKVSQSNLIDACRDWLEYLGVLIDYRTIDRGKLGYEIYVKTTAEDRWQDLTHVGVGVSQVLPIVLMALLSDNNDLLIFEQPELHLHPKIQSRLCDFFIAISSFGRQCLIETHSEYLINRLRRRIVQSRDDKILNDSSVFFVTKKNGLSNFEPVEINRFGAIHEWPEEFFDQTDMEVQSILLDATAKRRDERKGISDAHRSNDM